MKTDYTKYGQAIQKKIKKPKSHFFENINKNDQNLARLIF